MYRFQTFFNFYVTFKSSCYFTAVFFITSDAINKVMSYVPMLEVTKGKTLKKEIVDSLKKLNCILK